MLKVSNSLNDIAVLRGGSAHFKESLKEGGEVLTSLTKLGYHPLDVLIDKEGNWTTLGAPTDPHSIFTRAHTVIDVTRMRGQEYQKLAKRMHIPLLFSLGNEMTLDREDVYRLLRQRDIKVPNTQVIRASSPLKDEIFREIWLKYHTPLLVRPLRKNPKTPSRAVKMFSDFEQLVRDYHAKGVDVHVLTYKKLPTTSIAVLPNFRNEKVYTPLWVDSFTEGGDLPGESSILRPHLQAPEFRKEHIKSIATKVYEALGVSTPLCIDFIHHNNEFIVVNIDLEPSLAKTSRFMQSLATTGVDVGHYVHACIAHDFER
jgi:D-alanine-D-alanine ligase-like ATP-grasp enzyme